MNINNALKAIKVNAKHNSPIILSSLGGLGVLSTAYLTAKASFEAARLIDDSELTETVDRAKLVWKLYIPAGISAGATIMCIAGSTRVSANKIIAAQTALSATQQVYSDYREKVIEEYGKRKDENIRDKIAEERVKQNPTGQAIVIGEGKILCCELYTGRYFNSDMETLRRAVNDINRKVISQDYVTMTDFYYLIGLTPTSGSSESGWKSVRLMELQFTSVLTDDGKPCLAFDYNYVDLL